MARQINGFVGNFTSLTELTNRFPPSEYAGSSANYIVNGVTQKAWCNGTSWTAADPASISALVSRAWNPGRDVVLLGDSRDAQNNDAGTGVGAPSVCNWQFMPYFGAASARACFKLGRVSLRTLV